VAHSTKASIYIPHRDVHNRQRKGWCSEFMKRKILLVSARRRADQREFALDYCRMKKLLAIVAVGEAGTGLVLAVYPSIVVRLLFAADIAGAGVVMSRITGISLIALGIACWPGRGTSWVLYGMLTAYLPRSTSFTWALAASGPENCCGRPSRSTRF
jgi:hypothetical protein